MGVIVSTVAQRECAETMMCSPESTSSEVQMGKLTHGEITGRDNNRGKSQRD